MIWSRVDAALDRHRRERVALARLDAARAISCDRYVDDTSRARAAPRAAAGHVFGRSAGQISPAVPAAFVTSTRPVAVEDRPAGRLEPDRAQLVVLRPSGTGAGQDLQRPEAQEEDGEDGERERRRGWRSAARAAGSARYGSSVPGRGGRKRSDRGATALAKEAHLARCGRPVLGAAGRAAARARRPAASRIRFNATRRGDRRARRARRSGLAEDEVQHQVPTA